MLGGRYREKVQVYATGLYFTESMKDRMCKALAEEALMYKEQGYSAIKMKVGLGIEKDIQNVLAVKKAIGDDVKLAIDANHAYNFREALRLSKALEPYDIIWFEEPVSPEHRNIVHVNNIDEVRLRYDIR